MKKYTTKQYAKISGMNERTVRNYIVSGKLNSQTYMRPNGAKGYHILVQEEEKEQIAGSFSDYRIHLLTALSSFLEKMDCIINRVK